MQLPAAAAGRSQDSDDSRDRSTDKRRRHGPALYLIEATMVRQVHLSMASSSADVRRLRYLDQRFTAN